MPVSLWITLVAVVAAGLVGWAIASGVRKERARRAALDRAGFAPCPDKKGWLEETATRVGGDPDARYEVREPRRLPGAEIYYYVKTRQSSSDNPSAEEELLFPLERRSTGAAFFIVKPSSLQSGLATRILGSLVSLAGRRSDRLQKIELPRELQDRNVVAAMGPAGASLYDVVDSGTLSVIQGLGDAGGVFVQLADGWCAVTSASRQIPFQPVEMVSRIRPLLGRRP